MAQLIYQINSGHPNFTAHIEPNEAPNQIHSSTGVYSFDDIPEGEYSLTITDNIGCEAFIDNINIVATTTTTSSSSTTTSTTAIPTTTTTTSNIPLGLRLLWDNIVNVPVVDPSNVSQWNTFFDLPINGGAFTSVIVTGNVVTLLGGSNIILSPYLFGGSINGNNLLEIEDLGNCVIACADGVFSDFNDGSGCYNLIKIYLPVCTTLGNAVFGNCAVLSDLVLDYNAITTLGNDVFSGSGIVSLSFPNVTVAGNNVFYSCTMLVNLEIPQLVSALNDFCSNCFSLSSLSFPNLTNIGDNAFPNCTSLISIDLPLLETSGDNLVTSDNLLTTIWLPSLITTGNDSFSDCTLLTSINAPLLETIGDGGMGSCVNIVDIYMPSLLNMGSYVNDNSVFLNIIGQTVTLTIPSALMTCNGGSPDGDIQYLQANNIVTIITA